MREGQEHKHSLCTIIGAIHSANDFRIASFCPYDNPEVGIIFPT